MHEKFTYAVFLGVVVMWYLVASRETRAWGRMLVHLREATRSKLRDDAHADETVAFVVIDGESASPVYDDAALEEDLSTETISSLPAKEIVFHTFPDGREPDKTFVIFKLVSGSRVVVGVSRFQT